MDLKYFLLYVSFYTLQSTKAKKKGQSLPNPSLTPRLAPSPRPSPWAQRSTWSAACAASPHSPAASDWSGRCSACARPRCAATCPHWGRRRRSACSARVRTGSTCSAAPRTTSTGDCGWRTARWSAPCVWSPAPPSQPGRSEWTATWATQVCARRSLWLCLLAIKGTSLIND